MVNHRRKHAGYGLAVVACGLIVAETVLLVITALAVGWQTGFEGAALRQMIATTPLPLGIYLLWAGGVMASAAAVIAVLVYGFRERWFWRYLVVGSAAWLVFPPVHSIIGLLALLLLLKNRAYFPEHLPTRAAGP